MSTPTWNRRALGALRRRGVAVVELAIILPLLFLLLFGMIDFGRLLLVDNEITNLSREAANLASRGTSFPDTINAVFSASGTSDLNANGYIILTAIERDSNDNPKITRQREAGTQTQQSRVGSLNGPANIPVQGLPRAGQVLIVAEVFMNYSTVTPIGAFFTDSLPPYLYDSAYFY